MNTENKYKSWVITVNELEGIEFPSESQFSKILESISSRWYFQKEKGNRDHYQGCFDSVIRTRKKTLLNQIERDFNFDIRMFSIDRMRGSWDQNEWYCTKADSSISHYQSSEQRYSEEDIHLLDNRENRYPWQSYLIRLLLDKEEVSFKKSDDRTIIWIEDSRGNTGKSKFVKWMYVRYKDIAKISFGTSNQLRSAMIAAGPKSAYFIDVPKTLGTDDSMNSVLSAIEDLKNGFIVSSMYGKNQVLLIDPPHIVVFSNTKCPENLLSIDRWERYAISSISKSWMKI